VRRGLPLLACLPPRHACLTALMASHAPFLPLCVPSQQAPTSLHFQFYTAKPAEGAAAGAAGAGAAATAAAATAADDGSGSTGGGGSGLRVIDVPALDRLPESGERCGAAFLVQVVGSDVRRAHACMKLCRLLAGPHLSPQLPPCPCPCLNTSNPHHLWLPPCPHSPSPSLSPSLCLPCPARRARDPPSAGGPVRSAAGQAVCTAAQGGGPIWRCGFWSLFGALNLCCLCRGALEVWLSSMSVLLTPPVHLPTLTSNAQASAQPLPPSRTPTSADPCSPLFWQHFRAAGAGAHALARLLRRFPVQPVPHR